jgi:hypothetical protein
MWKRHHLWKAFGKTSSIATFIALSPSVMIDTGGTPFIAVKNCSNNHLKVSAFSLTMKAQANKYVFP